MQWISKSDLVKNRTIYAVLKLLPMLIQPLQTSISLLFVTHSLRFHHIDLLNMSTLSFFQRSQLLQPILNLLFLSQQIRFLSSQFVVWLENLFSLDSELADFRRNVSNPRFQRFQILKRFQAAFQFAHFLLFLSQLQINQN